MLIVSKIERLGGSTVTLGGTSYRFEPTDKIKAHVAEVDNPDHIRALLDIREGFAPFSEEEARDLDVQTTPEQRLEQQVEPQGNPEQQGDGQTPEQRLEQNAEGNEGTEGQTEGAGDEGGAQATPEQQLEQNVEPQSDGLEDMDNLTLEHAYHDAIGKKPNANMKRETMISRIRAANTAG